jgi:hypothetical protein
MPRLRYQSRENTDTDFTEIFLIKEMEVLEQNIELTDS